MDTRTVVLIDSDLQFYGEVSQRLAPYGFEIHQGELEESSIEMAISLAAELVVVAVDLPDKTGFALFPKAQQSLSCPIILKTDSIAPEDMAKHQSLNAHADGYIDHRTQTSDEFLHLVEALIGLNARRLDSNPDFGFDLGEEESADPLAVLDNLEAVEEIEAEELEMEEFDIEDIVEEEQEELFDVADEAAPAAEFRDESTSVAPPSAAFLAASIADETDAAFAALGFGDEEGAGTKEFDAPDEIVAAASGAVPEPLDAALDESSGIPMAIEDGYSDDASLEQDANLDSLMDSLDDDPGQEYEIVDSLDEPRQAAETDSDAYSGDGVAAAAEFEPEEEVPDLVLATPQEPLLAPEPVYDDEEPMEAAAEPELAYEEPIEADPEPELAYEEPIEADPEPELAYEEPMEAAAEPQLAPALEAQAEPEPEQLAETAPEASDDLDLGLAAIAETAAEEHKAASTIGPDDLAALHSENANLKRQLETAQAAAASGGSAPSKEREFLDLRERINKKEKALLDAQDQLTAKDRELLDSKDNRLALERGKATLEDKILQLEQELLSGREGYAQLTGQLQQEQASAQAAAAQHAQAIAASAAAHAQAIAASAAAHADEGAAAAAAHADEVAAETSRHADELGRVKTEAEASAAQRQQEIANLQAELQRAKEEHETVLAQNAQEHAQAIEALRAESAEALASRQSEIAGLTSRQEELEAAHAAAFAGAQQESANALAEAQSSYEAALAQAQEAHAAELALAIEQQVAAAAAAAAEQGQALQAAAEEREASETQLISKAAADREALEQEHAEVVAGHERENAELRSALSSSRERITEVEAQLAAVQATSDERQTQLQGKDELIALHDDRIAALKHEISELEAQNAGYQEQVLKAYQKIKNDEGTVGRAKKAMAIALTLLDESAELSGSSQASAGDNAQ